MRNKSKNAGTVPRKQQKCTASQWSEEKLNEEKNNICLMHFRYAFGVIRTEKKEMTQCILRGYTILTEAGL